MKVRISLLVAAGALALTACDQYPHRSAAPGGIGQVGVEVEGVADLMPEGVHPATASAATLCDEGDLASCHIVASLMLAPAEDHGDDHAEDHGDDHAEDHGDDHAEDHGDDHAEDHGDDHAEDHGDDHGGHHAYAAVPHNPERAYELLGMACDGGFVGACWQLGAHGQSHNEVGPEVLMHEACEAGHLSACYQTGLMVAAHEATAVEDASWYLSRACAGGIRDACLAPTL